MASSNSQCDRVRLRELLDDKLPQESQDELTRHLDSCPDCRKELEALAADPDWWREVQQLLSTEVNLNNSTSADNISKSSISLVPNVTGLRLNFLSPSEDPKNLGRLGPYEIVKVIGRGGMGIVLKGFDSALNRYVAIKVLSPQWMHSEAARRRFAREAQAAAAVVHEHVIAIHAVDSANEMPYLVMPFIDGISLQDCIDREAPLKLEKILEISIQIAAGLAAAHAQGLVHRDIKPANILLENGAQRVLITDFGLARAVDDASFTRSCFIAGTPEYMAPEQANGEFVDHRIDLFSLGSVMYAMCTGQSPFRRETTMAVLRRICEGTTRPIREINPDIPAWLEKIIARLHAKKPAERFQNAGDVVKLLMGWLAHVQQPTVYHRPHEPSEQWHGLAGFPRQLLRLRWASAAALLVLIAGLTATETMGITRLSHWFFGTQKSNSSTGLPVVAVDRQSDATAAKQDGTEFHPANDAVFDKRIDDLRRQFKDIETKLSLGDTADTPDMIERFRLQLAELQAELPEYRRNKEAATLQQVGAAIEKLKQLATPVKNGRGIDSSLQELNSRIEQLNQDLYRDFP